MYIKENNNIPINTISESEEKLQTEDSAHGFGEQHDETTNKSSNSSDHQQASTNAQPDSLSHRIKALQSFERLRITDKTPIERPVPVIKIGEAIISTPGNITTISGPSKSGKSAFTAPILAGAISRDGNILDPFENLYVLPNTAGKAVIQLDTEQALHKQQENVKGIIRRAGLLECPDYYLSYNFRALELEEYKRVTLELFRGAQKDFGGIHLVVVDGVADFIENVNHAQQSNAIVKFFEELAVQYQTTIIFILHTNPSNDKERGHLGSQCQRKSESVLTIKNSSSGSYVVPKLLRMAGKADVPELHYCYDEEKGYHVSCGDWTGEESKKDEERRKQLWAIAEAALPHPTALPYKDTIARIMKVTGKQVATSKGLFSDMKGLAIISQTESKRWQLNQQEALLESEEEL